ncbi:glutamate cyclase domain-containing protein [uncultured Tateyamaria sp.]|uniref:glutamate cyclase domain-containing protein n=1 Tax=uncultured Tateyamaria sp. TaxID=455651 RepID=UPI00263918AB|nr:glutamate cyclase domain-containing protein [uncultured Tateyamaria sp.]
MSDFVKYDEQLDRLVNLDIGNRGIEPLYDASRALVGGPLVAAAADRLLAIPQGGSVIVTTGSVSRAWLSPELGENDGPSGAAAVVRALWLARRATTVVVIEETLIAAMAAVLRACGLAVVDHATAREASADGSMACVVLESYPVEDVAGQAAARDMLKRLKPDLLFSTERVGRNENGIYYNMRGRDYGMGRARIDMLFDEGLARGIPVVAVGDGGNEIGMGVVADVVKTAIPYGGPGDCPCGGGIGAVSGADVLVTAAVSNWGCSAICAAMALRVGDARLVHTPAMEARLLEVMTANGLINSADGIIDPHVDGIRDTTHIALAEMAEAVVRKALA